MATTKLRTNIMDGEFILADLINAVNRQTNNNSEAVESLKNSLLEAALNGGTVNAASNILLASDTGLNASNVQDALKEIVALISETIENAISRVPIVDNDGVLTCNGKRYQLIYLGVASNGDSTSVCGKAICGQAICGNL